MRHTSRLLASVMGVVYVFAMVNSPALAQRRGATGEQIQSAIDKGKVFLLRQQAADGSWDVANSQLDAQVPGYTWGGFTALSTYALLASGSSPQDPPIKKAVAWLENCKMKGIYCIGVRMQVWLLLWQQTDRSDRNVRAHYVDLANKDADFLVKNLNLSGPYIGLWNYLGPNQVGAGAQRIDHSVSQYGVLGLWAGVQMGAEVPDTVWKLLDKTWSNDQFPDGGWSYWCSPAIPPHGPNSAHNQCTPAMTAAGIASLFIIDEYANSPASYQCHGDAPNNHIESGLTWMSAHFSQVSDLYTYYGIERIGVASGYKYFGDVDWFATLSANLISSQAGNGSWAYDYEAVGPVAGTSFALLFLERGGAPVMINKLDYSTYANGHRQKEADWNERPRDAFNLARWTGEEAEASNLNWQVVNLVRPVEELHDAPILLLTGDKAIKLTDADIDKLRTFVAEGGMILGNADCNSIVFAESFKKLGAKLFPKYEFRQLDLNHVIYTGETYKPKKMRGHQPIFGLSNGVREMMLLFATGDPAHFWQQNATKTRTEAFQIGSDIFQYAADAIGSKALRTKAESYIVLPDASNPSKSINVARLMVGDNPDPEPGGWVRLSAILHNDFSLGVTVTPAKSGEVLAGNYQIVHLTGTTHFKLDDKEQQILKDFIAKGGTLIIDAAGGNGTFATSAESALREMYPDESAKGLKKALPLVSPVFDQPNAKIAAVKYRRFAQKLQVESLTKPHLRGIEIGGRLAIFYSREDLSAGMVGEEVDGIFGYSPDSAIDLMRNLVLYSAR